MNYIKQRTCVGCNKVFDKESLLRIVLQNSVPVIDKNQNLQGRACYVCKNEDCISKAMKKKSFNRSFKQDISLEALGRCFNDR